MSSPSSKSPELSDKSKKYDRQLRLWGEHGQALLESANVCLVNATAVGCEILKSLVLPCIGSFTIADGNIVAEHDLGVNFFLDTDSIGKSRAAECTRFLQELNPDVHGDYMDESVDYILENRPAFFDSFDVVIASNLSEKSLINLSKRVWAANTPLVYCRSLGFFGSIRLQFKEHHIMEAHPDNRQFDLRLEQPFPALRDYLDKTEVTIKVPWLLVLNKYLKVWKELNDGRMPSTYKEKMALRAMIKEDADDRENYEEACKAVNTAFGSDSITPNLKEIFNSLNNLNLDKDSKPFWIIMKAIKQFVENDNNNHLPLSGILPDMTADTEHYLNLQNIYRQQAMQDAENVYRKCQDILKEIGLPSETINPATVRLACREAAGLTVLYGTSIADECEKNTHIQNIVDDLEVGGTLAEHYVGLRAYERFRSECGNVPGECYVENDIGRLKSIVTKMLSDWGSHTTSVSDDMVHEICHYGGAELHSISAFIGGCAAHEVIKLLTNQYRPADNTLLYNGITTETVTKKL